MRKKPEFKHREEHFTHSSNETLIRKQDWATNPTVRQAGFFFLLYFSEMGSSPAAQAVLELTVPFSA